MYTGLLEVMGNTNNIKYSKGEFKDSLSIYESLSKKEKGYLPDRFIDSPNLCYREITYHDNKPIGFIEGYDWTKINHSIEITIAIHKNYRRLGIARKLIKRFLLQVINGKVKTKDKLNGILYHVDKRNRESINLAKSTSFELIPNYKYNSVGYYKYIKYIDDHGNGSKYKFTKDLNKYLNKFQWGCVYDGKVNTDPSEKDFYEKYKTLSIEEFEKVKAGCCWDYVNFEKIYFDEHYLFDTKCYYIENEKLETHTCLLYCNYDGWVWFESSWKKYAGLHHSISLEGLLEDIVFRFKLENGDKAQKINIYEYDAGEEFIGLSCQEFINKARKGKKCTL